MKKEKFIICDWGGVIESHKDVYSVFEASINQIKLYTNNFTNEEILKMLSKCSTNKKGKNMCELGNINDIYEWIDRINEIFKINVSYDVFLADYKATHSLVYSHDDVVKFIKSIKDKCKICILSNLMLIDKERIDKHMGLSDFDNVFLSYEMGFKKPDSKIYIMVENALKTKPENILFIDDTKENIETAKRLGWYTCLATGNDLDLIKQSVNKFLNL